MIIDVKFKREHTGDVSMMVKTDDGKPITKEEKLFVNNFAWIVGAFHFLLPVGICTPLTFIRRIQGVYDTKNGDPRLGLAVEQLKTLPSEVDNA